MSTTQQSLAAPLCVAAGLGLMAVLLAKRGGGKSTARVKGLARAKTALDEVGTDGSFKRTEAGFKNEIKEGSRFPPEAGRYHLYIALGCPWANGVLTALHYKGLDKVIGVSIVHPTWNRTRPHDPTDEHCGWHFRAPGDPPMTNELGHGSFECDDALIPDTVNGAKHVRELYEKANDGTGKYSTPFLWCKKESTIVSNESMVILKSFDEAFQELCSHPERRLFPPEPAHARECEAFNEFIYPTINNGVYRCGFARSQGAYDTAVDQLYASLDRLEAHLGSRKDAFLTGDGAAFTWIDLRLYNTLVRFDPVYVVYFKCNPKMIKDYPHLLAFMRKCYAIPAVKATTNIKHIKMHYFSSHKIYNPFGVIPKSNGPALE